jgi:hypothetical protein
MIRKKYILVGLATFIAARAGYLGVVNHLLPAVGLAEKKVQPSGFCYDLLGALQRTDQWELSSPTGNAFLSYKPNGRLLIKFHTNLRGNSCVFQKDEVALGGAPVDVFTEDDMKLIIERATEVARQLYEQKLLRDHKELKEILGGPVNTH